MAKVQKTVITALGEQMLFSSALTYTNATLCSQDISNLTIDQLRSLTDLTGKVLSSPISAHKRQGNTKADQVDVQVTFTNQDQKADINYSSIGWFARDHQGQETLIAVTPFIGTDTIAAAPPDGAATSSKNITLSMAAGTATEINVLIDPAGSVTPSTFNAEVDKINEALALKADNAELADYAKKADVNSALDAKADKTALDPLAKSEDVAKDIDTVNKSISSMSATITANQKATDTALDTKADKTTVNQELSTKANSADVDDKLAAKADSADVTKQIKTITDLANTKADQTALDATNATVATKANSTDVYTKTDTDKLLDAKADKTTVEQELAVKANSADVDKKLDEKADKATVDAEIAKIDFTPYAKSADVDSKLQGYTNTADLTKLLDVKANAVDVYSKTELDKKLLDLSTDTGGKVNADQVSSMIANKADKSDLASDLKSINDSIATKADKTTVESDLATKADQSSLDETNAEVAKKANSEDVTKQLATKANVSDVDDALSKKDDTADVDQKIATVNKSVSDLSDTVSANKTATDASLATKANASDVADNVKTLQANIDAKADASNVYSKSEVDSKTTATIVTGYDIPSKTRQTMSAGVNVKWLVGPAVIDIVADQINQLKGRRTIDTPDFNSLTDGGSYYITNTQGGKNVPTGSWGNLFVSNGNGHRISQLYFPDDGSAPFMRELDESTWHNWIQLSTKQDVNNATNAANAASNKIDTVLANSYVRKQGMNANGDCVEIKHTGIKQASGGYAFDMWWDDWTASKLNDVIKNQLPSKANTTDVNNALNGKANTGDVTALQNKVNVTTPLFREISDDSTWEDIFGVTNPTNVLTSLRINPGGNGQLVNDYAAGIGFGGNDTKAVISVDFGSHVARFTAGNGISPGWSEDVAWKSDISSLTQALTKLQAAFDAQQTKIAALQATVNNQANQLTYFKQHYIEGKAFDADQIKQAMAWTDDDGQKLAIIRDKENEGGK